MEQFIVIEYTIFTLLLLYFILCLRYEIAGAIMFSGCPSVPFSWLRYPKNPLMDSCQTLVMYVSCRADELMRFWGHEVKGHRAHYVCKNSLWSRYLKNRLMDYRQTWVMYVSCRADELIRFGGSRGQRSQGHKCIWKIACSHHILRTC